ncbi:MAG TPA: DUF3592 domain-containing protein [Thermohalobaculum sp.]|nr:DUF3592 domain-containing protein [Thermohalobaculum sp.]
MSRRAAVAKGSRWFAWVGIAVPLIFIALGLWMLADSVRFAAEAERTSGEVIEVLRNRNSKGNLSYTPIIRFRRGDGQVIEAKSHMSSSMYDYEIGTPVDILYSYNDIGEVRFDTFFSVYGLGLIFALGGAAFLVVFRMLQGKTTGAAIEGPLPEADPGQRPNTTDPSRPGHAHEPKPKQPSAVQRMR